ncbi:MAG: CHASE domain-containing protein [Sulfurimonas sp.]|uniref:CHASE domain-containing protein n=1 Tax=Sulfurimonas sp. TaxID=2022749 RepID=UPI0028CCBC50|nr:CHASE domain-containing protein [Sulfurimonas sp.]MDT8338216.1 CHASE domain-containing protein [Sulfurimonas sp.]
MTNCNHYSMPLRNGFVYNRATISLAILLSLLVGAIIWNAAQNYYHFIAAEKFETAVNENIESINKRMLKYETLLQGGIALFHVHGGIGLFHGSESITRKEWHDFIKAIDIRKNYPGIQGIGFSKMLQPEDVVKVEQEMRDEGFASFSIKPAGERKIYSSILYLEPMDKRNMAAIGYDMFSEPVRRAAMQRAIESGEASISGKVTLMQEIDEDVQPGILMYLPLYEKGANIETIEERRKALIGFVYSPFRMNDLMEKIVLKSSILNFEIYDGEDISKEHLLYRSFKPNSYRSKFNTEKSVELNNATWHIRFSSTKEFDNSADVIYPLLMTAAGLAVQFLLLFIILMLFKSRYMLKIQAQELTKLSQAVEQSPSSIIITNLDGKIEYVNRAFTEITGYTKDEAIGKNPHFLESGKTGADAYDDMWKTIKLGKTWHGEFVNKNKNGEEYIEGVKAAPIFQADGTISHYMAIKEDITDKKRAEERIHFLANFDALTGLPNRYQLEERLKYTIGAAKRNSEQFSIIFLDLDLFKEVNDTLGHDAGDALLVELAKRFNAVLREVDTASRVGGDEFIFLLPNTPSSGVSHIAEKLLKIIDTPCEFNRSEMRVTASIGIAIYPEDGLDQQTLFKKADTAMYEAKENGRNRYRFFNKEN